MGNSYYTRSLQLSYNDDTRQRFICQEHPVREFCRIPPTLGMRCVFYLDRVVAAMIKQEFLRMARLHPVAAAIKGPEDIEVALSSDVALIFMLKGDAFQLAPMITRAHKLGKGVVVHVDLV